MGKLLSNGSNNSSKGFGETVESDGREGSVAPCVLASSTPSKAESDGEERLLWA